MNDPVVELTTACRLIIADKRPATEFKPVWASDLPTYNTSAECIAVSAAERPVTAAMRLHIRNVGWFLYSLGGEDEMRSALNKTAARFRGQVKKQKVLSIVDHGWDGIGRWHS